MKDDALPIGGGGTDDDDVITVKAAGNSYKGDPNFIISVNGTVIDSSNKVTAVRDSGNWQTFVFNGDFVDDDRDQQDVQIRFDNDYNEGTGKDRNLVIDEVCLNGEVNDYSHTFKSNSAEVWDFLL